jgi:hypothetical protein
MLRRGIGAGARPDGVADIGARGGGGTIYSIGAARGGKIPATVALSLPRDFFACIGRKRRYSVFV